MDEPWERLPTFHYRIALRQRSEDWAFVVRDKGSLVARGVGSTQEVVKQAAERAAREDAQYRRDRAQIRAIEYGFDA